MEPSPKMAGVTSSLGGHPRIRVFQVQRLVFQRCWTPAAVPRCCGSCRCSCEDQTRPPGVLLFTVKQRTTLCSAFTFCKILIQMAWNKPRNSTNIEILLAEHCWVCASSDWSGLLHLLGSWSTFFPSKYWGIEIPKLSLTEKQGLSSSRGWVSF